MPNDLLVTTTDILGIEVAKEYSGASGIYVDNENNVISITGEVGKEYNGIEPIVVNNEENLISANSAPIGVQEPLYFVQDDDEAVIIGLSGEYVTPSDITGKLDTSSFESWQQGQYTNDLTAINEKINEVSSNFEGYATEQWVEDKGYLTEVSIPESASWNETSEVVESNSGTWNTVSDKLDVTAQVISSCETSSVNDKTLVTKLNGNEIAVSYAGSAHVADIALKDYQGNSFIPFYAKTSALEEKLDTTAFSTVSGDFLTAHQSLNDYYTKDETSGKEELAQAFANIPGGDLEVNAYIHNSSASIDGTTSVVQSNSSTWSDITAHQSISADEWNDCYDNVNTNSGSWGGSALPISAGAGIDVQLSNNMLVFSAVQNETLLFSGNIGQNSNADLSDNWHNYDRIKVYGYSEPGGGMCSEARVVDMEAAIVDGSPCPDINLFTVASWIHRSEFNIIDSLPVVFSADASFGTLNERLMGYWNGDWNITWGANRIHVTKIVGIK